LIPIAFYSKKCPKLVSFLNLGPVEFVYKGDLIVCNTIEEFKTWNFEGEVNRIL
jgi:hypothetical protein